MPTRGWLSAGEQGTAEIPQATLESLDEFGVDGWLHINVTA